MPSFPSGDLQFVLRGGSRFLFNHRDTRLLGAQFADLLVSSNEGEAPPFVFPTPVYQLEDLPPHSYTDLASPDKYLDGYTLWRIYEAEWEDGQAIEEPLIVPQRKLWGGAIFSETHVQREVEHLHTEPERRARPVE